MVGFAILLSVGHSASLSQPRNQTINNKLNIQMIE